MQNYKVIFHIDEMNKWKLLLANVNNMLIDLKDQSVKIKILANSEAVKFFVQKELNENDYSNIQNLMNNNVLFCLCNNSILSNKIELNTLIPNISNVYSCVSELIIKQMKDMRI